MRDDWTEGLQLVDYTFAAADSAIRPYQDVPIELVLRDASGSIVRRRAIYQVALEPHAAVLRSDH